MGEGAEKSVCVGGEIDPCCVGFEVEDCADEGRVLVREAVVFLAGPG